ncbi:MAG: hypothetical protein GOVbin2917_20 [Prokaryotic dsDNA virus sp.]|jgi:hypothetical protein|nr:MAG: hypothetical protein GOVbin2917_20 [Prokaryotic dsDNA virus sp.]|tara:strand:- start:92446 stop:92649 length:204 start_codon:yes stop_codon:yes gene_type:complete
MRVNLEGEPLSKGVTEIEVDDLCEIQFVDDDIIELNIEGELFSLDINRVKRLIKGLELAVKEMLEDE